MAKNKKAIAKNKNKLEKKATGEAAARFSEAEFSFPDYQFCQAMKAAEDRGRELSVAELKGAFVKANKSKKPKS